MILYMLNLIDERVVAGFLSFSQVYFKVSTTPH